MKTYLEGIEELEMELPNFLYNINDKNIEGGITTNNIINSSSRRGKLIHKGNVTHKNELEIELFYICKFLYL